MWLKNLNLFLNGQKTFSKVSFFRVDKSRDCVVKSSVISFLVFSSITLGIWSVLPKEPPSSPPPPKKRGGSRKDWTKYLYITSWSYTFPLGHACPLEKWKLPLGVLLNYSKMISTLSEKILSIESFQIHCMQLLSISDCIKCVLWPSCAILLHF